MLHVLLLFVDCVFFDCIVLDIFRVCRYCSYGYHVAPIASIILRRLYVAQVLLLQNKNITENRNMNQACSKSTSTSNSDSNNNSNSSSNSNTHSNSNSNSNDKYQMLSANSKTVKFYDPRTVMCFIIIILFIFCFV